MASLHDVKSWKCIQHRRTVCLALALLALMLAPGPVCLGADARGKMLVYVGTYTSRTGSQGIYRLVMDTKTGALSTPRLAAKSNNPSFLAMHPNGRWLYAVNEVGSFQRKKSGGVSAFAIDPNTGDLTLLNQQPSGGPGPCHVVVDGSGKYVLVANYGGGSVCVLPITREGKLGKQTAFVQHKGSSVKPRQKGPHAHSINVDKENERAFVADLGLDKVMIYRFDARTGTLKANAPPFVALAPGAGPRHFAFHPTGKYAYVINEMTSTVTAMKYNPTTGALTKMQTLSTLPRDFKGGNSTAEVQVHPSGKFLYGSNRGQNSIAIFRIARTGKLTPQGHQGHKIKVPRNFGIDPTGTFLIAASQAGNNLVVFRINQKTGALSPAGHSVEVPRPVCVKFLSR